MARDPETIQREIEQARNSLASTLDVLGEKASPQRAVENVQSSVQQKLDDPRVRYALIGAGVIVGLLVLRKLVR